MLYNKAPTAYLISCLTNSVNIIEIASNILLKHSIINSIIIINSSVFDLHITSKNKLRAKTTLEILN